MEEIKKKWKRLEEEARRIRENEADWEFIEKQPPKIKAALKYYIKEGDIRIASKLADLPLEKFREIIRKANIPVVV